MKKFRRLLPLICGLTALGIMAYMVYTKVTNPGCSDEELFLRDWKWLLIVLILLTVGTEYGTNNE